MSDGEAWVGLGPLPEVKPGHQIVVTRRTLRRGQLVWARDLHVLIEVQGEHPVVAPVYGGERYGWDPAAVQVRIPREVGHDYSRELACLGVWTGPDVQT